MKYGLLTSILALCFLIYQHGITDSMAACHPTPQDALGPFYKPNAPMRSSVGKGYVLTGTVRSSKDCSAIEGARIEFWLADPNGRYDDDHRATLLSEKSGGYRFESNFPPPYSGRPSHVHIRVSAQGYKTLVTQHYPAQGRTGGDFDLILTPSE
jgi:protocatechuate 3,4-dioxygenase beta subunit